MSVVCRECGRDIVRVYIAGLDGWGHATHQGPNHHYATPAVSRTAPEPAMSPRSSNGVSPDASAQASPSVRLGTQPEGR